MFRAKVTIMLREDILDPQGAAIERALKSRGHGKTGEKEAKDGGDILSFPDVASVRVGKIIELTLDGKDASGVEAEVRLLADRILANPVMEEYSVCVEPLPQRRNKENNTK